MKRTKTIWHHARSRRYKKKAWPQKHVCGRKNYGMAFRDLSPDIREALRQIKDSHGKTIPAWAQSNMYGFDEPTDFERKWDKDKEFRAWVEQAKEREASSPYITPLSEKEWEDIDKHAKSTMKINPQTIAKAQEYRKIFGERIPALRKKYIEISEGGSSVSVGPFHSASQNAAIKSGLLSREELAERYHYLKDEKE